MIDHFTPDQLKVRIPLSSNQIARGPIEVAPVRGKVAIDAPTLPEPLAGSPCRYACPIASSMSLRSRSVSISFSLPSETSYASTPAHRSTRSHTTTTDLCLLAYPLTTIPTPIDTLISLDRSSDTNQEP